MCFVDWNGLVKCGLVKCGLHLLNCNRLLQETNLKETVLQIDKFYTVVRRLNFRTDISDCSPPSE